MYVVHTYLNSVQNAELCSYVRGSRILNILLLLSSSSSSSVVVVVVVVAAVVVVVVFKNSYL